MAESFPLSYIDTFISSLTFSYNENTIFNEAFKVPMSLIYKI